MRRQFIGRRGAICRISAAIVSGIAAFVARPLVSIMVGSASRVVLELPDSAPQGVGALTMANLLDRRRFCQSGLAASIAASTILPGANPAQVEAADRSGPTPIIDTHQHLWDLTRFSLPWLVDYQPLRRSYLLRDYWEAARATNIVKTIYMEVDVEPSQRDAEVDYVVSLAAQPDSQMAGAVVGGQPESARFAEYVQKLTKQPLVKGVRAVVRSRAQAVGFELDTNFVSGIRLLGERGLSFDVNVQPDELDRAAALVDAAPATRFILDHCGNVNLASGAAAFARWKRGLADVAKRHQVTCKISGFITNSPGKTPTHDEIAGVVNHVYECFGPDRVIFASDWPVCTLAMPLATWVTTLQEIVQNRPVADQRKLFHDNAVGLYRA